MKRRISLTALVFVAMLAPITNLAAQASGPRREKPNIVFILADDLGWTDLGCMGSKYYETPHIDRMAREGLLFTDAYTAAPNCAPTRACLMTGRYTPRHGVYTVGSGARGLAKFRRMIPVINRTQLPLRERTIAEELKGLGYRTALFGKWHLGNKGPYHPSKRGFDEAIVASGRHFNFPTVPKVKVDKGTYLADFLTDKAVDFIRRNKDRPFFLYLSHFAVHTPLQAKENWKKHFAKKKGVGGHNNPTYAAMIASVDESVGRVLDAIRSCGLDENTIVIFSSDNGGVGGYRLAGILGALEITVNTPLRAGKGTLYEGGVRVPFIVRWAGTIRPGSRCSQPIISVDLFPTFRELAGARKPAKNALDGVSLVSLLESSGKTPLPDRCLYWHFPGYLQASIAKGTWRTTPAGSIRCGSWKLIEYFEDGRLELYNLDTDLEQRKNLADRDRQRAEELRARLRAWRTRVHAPMPKLKSS